MVTARTMRPYAFLLPFTPYFVLGWASHAHHKHFARDINQCQQEYNSLYYNCVNSKIGCPYPQWPQFCESALGSPSTQYTQPTAGATTTAPATISTTSDASTAQAPAGSGAATGTATRGEPGNNPTTLSDCKSVVCHNKMSADENTGGGSCGFDAAFYNEHPHYIAISHEIYEADEDPSNWSPLCGAPVTITAMGQTIDAVIVDK
jgi:hypothetical protein